MSRIIDLKRFVFCFLCVLVGTAANFFGSVFARHIVIPLYLDSLLTFAVTASAGFWAGIACAVLSNVVLWIFYKSALPFIFCHVITAIVAYYTFRHYRGKASLQGGVNPQPMQKLSIDAFLWAGLWSAITNAISGNIIISFFIKSPTSPNVDNSVQGIFIAVPNLIFAVYFSGILTNLTDKIISAVVSFGIYKGIMKLAID